MKATKVRDLDREGGYGGRAALYRLAPPVKFTTWDPDAGGCKEMEKTAEFVVVSAVVAMYSGPETYIFPASPEGEVTDWGELNGSFRGALDHGEALRRAGYEVRDANS